MEINLHHLVKANAASAPSQDQHAMPFTRIPKAYRFTFLALVFSILALAGMLTAPVSDTPAAQAQTTDIEVWSATLTAEESLAGTIVSQVGFNRDDSTADIGNLSDETFYLAGTSYTVTRLLINFPSLTTSRLNLTLDTAPGDHAANLTAPGDHAANLTLHIGSVAFPLRDAIVSANEKGFSWPGHGLSWADDDTIAVRLTYSLPPADPCPGVDNCFEVPTTWELAPAGIRQGESFRLLFFSSTSRDATSSDIDDYNTFVQNLSLNGHSAIFPYSGYFRAVGSTADDDARDNTATTGTGVPIYWLDGNKLADDYTDFYDGSWDDEGQAKNESGNVNLPSSTNQAWTGSNSNGTESFVSGTSAALGESSVQHAGLGSRGGSNTPFSGSTLANTNTRPLYALSPVFKGVTDPPTEVAHDWSLIPDGLRPGDKFRILFATSTTHNATSTNIATYNTFVQAAAAGGHTDIQQYSAGFRALAGTVKDHARDNTVTTYTNDDKGVPIYWLDGTKLADEYEDFYDGSWDDEANAKDESGDARSLSADADRPFTGSSSDGSQAFFGLISSRALGATTVRVGQPDNATSGQGPIGSTVDEDNTDTRPFYALSQVFEIPLTNALWSATLTTGESLSGTTVLAVGYEGIGTNTIGSLSDDDFELDGTSYTVDRLKITSPASANELKLALDTATASLANYLVLSLDDNAFPLSTAKVSTDGLVFTWTNHNLSWADSETIAARIDYSTYMPPSRPCTDVDNCYEVLADSALVPTGIETGSSFRLMFLSSTKRDASSTDIADYNTFIQARANAGHSAIQGYAPLFRAIGSTADSDARDNTATNGTGVPIYWLRGNKAADDYADFYDGGWDEEASVTNESGTTITIPHNVSTYDVWTGSNRNGTEGFQSGASHALGTANPFVGTLNNSIDPRGPLRNHNTNEPKANTNHLYGLSPVFKVVSHYSLTETDVPSDWTLVPDGLNTGDSFRLLFITSTTRDASSKKIADYNAFVQTAAAAGHAHIQAYSDTFQAVASTKDTDARDNTATSFTSDNKGFPIYWLGGTKVVDDYEDFYDGSWDDEANAKDESGNARSTSAVTDYPWTGSEHDGTEAILIPWTLSLGATRQSPGVGIPNSTAQEVHGPLYGGQRNKSNSQPLYGLSGLFKVGTNGVPVFTETPPAARSLPENTPAGENVGAPVTATDVGSADKLVYSLDSDDGASFDIDTTNGQILTKSEVSYDYEAKQTYSVTVSVNDGTDTATLAVTITLTDVSEPPDAPEPPTVTTTAGATDSLDVAWTAPDNTGRPAITDYDVQYQSVGSETWTDLTHIGTDLSTTIATLATDTHYKVRVRATNDDGTGPWSDPGQAPTNGPPTEVPSAWGLIPTGLATGDKFRILFATSTTRDATSTDISEYNTFVRTAAAAGHADIQAYSAEFTVVGSTSATDARVNTRTTYTPDEKGVPIYWLDGTKVADEYEDFYDGDWDDETNSKDESGNARSLVSTVDRPFTGSDHDGTESFSSSVSRALGTDTVRVGRPDNSAVGRGPLGSGSHRPHTDSHPFYAISPVFVIDVSPGVTITPTSLTVTEGSTADYTVELSVLPTADVTINITGGGDVTVNPSSLTFSSTTWNMAQTVTVTAGRDSDSVDDSQTVAHTVATSSAPEYVGATLAGMAVTVTDNDVTATFEFATYSVGEGNTVTVKVQLNADPKRNLTIPISTTNQEGATNADYSGVPASVAFASGDMEKSFTFTATEDTVDDNGESVKLSFGTLPTGVTAGTTNEATITITGPISVPQGWALIPTGLGQGDKFRLLFITHTGHSSANTDIENYNAYVQSQANAGNAHADIKAYSSWFRVLGSTESIDARDNTMTTGTGVPIYWMNGDKVADNYADFYDGSWDSETAADRTGTTSSASVRIWTGSDSNGVEAIPGAASRALGTNSVRLGRLNGAGDPISTGGTANAGTNYRYYALSGIFLVGEPTSTNNVATGLPTITGTARVNEVLTADTSGINDDDGITSVSYEYQWAGFDGTVTTNITGATSETYTLQPEDAGSQIQVTITFTDDLSNPEGPLSSALTDAVNTPATGAPTITGAARVNNVLTASTSDVSDADGTDTATFTYQWVRFDRTVTTDISGATASTYTLTADDVDQRIKVKVSFTDDAGAPAGAEGPLASLPTDPVAGSDVLVRNTGKPVFTGASATLSSSSSKFAQRFTTGSTLVGYALNSISVLFTTIGDTTTVGTELTVTLNADDSGSPGDPLCTLSDPATFFASGIHTFSTPTTGTDLCPTLDPSTTYYVVLSRANGNTHVIVVSATNILAQDSGSAQGWTIDDRSHVYTNASSTWAQATIPSNLLIDVRGDTGNEVTVPANWSLKPTGLTTGNKFRLMFITGTGHAPSSTDITTYNTYVQGQAAVGHADIQDYSSAFHVLGSTVDVDARDNTDTTGTGVPTYWLNGTKVADDYPDLYDGTWDDEANTTNRDGTTITTPGHVFTGSADDGTEEFDGGASRAFGSSRVRTGRPDSSAHGPLSSSSSYLQSQTLHPYYALSMVFVIPNNLPTGLPKITGTPRVDQTLTADTSAIEDKDGLSNVNYAYQWIRNDGTNDADINGATSLTYTLKSEDADNQIKVNVTFTDDAGDTEGPLTSLPTEYVAAADVLVKNTGHTTTNAADIADGSTKYGQRFTSGPSLTGYTLTSIGVHFTEIGNTATVGAELTATLNADSSGAPGDALCTLADPNNFSASGLHAFTAPTTGTDLCPELEPSTTYFVVLERANLNTGTIEWSVTSTLGQHPGSANGWSIDDRGHIYNNALSTWVAFQAPYNLIIEVKGDLDTETTVPADWSLIPAGLTSGDSFRLLFLTAAGHSPTSTNIADYNTYVQGRAAGGHADIQDYSYWFRVLGSTENTEAIDNTRTFYIVSSGEGVPIYWLNGSKVADEYEDFYDGDWDDEANPRDRNGATVSPGHVWTGSITKGFGLPNSTFGQSSVGTGQLDSDSADPVFSQMFFTPATDWPYYALSGVFVVEESPGATITPSTLTVAEGSTADYTVKLTHNPTADVTINITAGGDVSVNPASLTFTTSTWSTDQTVTVTAAQDSDAADDSQTVTHAVDSGSADEYLGATLDSLDVTVTDDETPGITATPSTLTVAEGGTADYTVELSVVPTADVTVTITGGGDVTVNPSSLTFSTSTWNMAQTVTVTADRDSDSVDDSQTVAHTVATDSAPEYVGATLASLAVTVADNDVTATFDNATYSVDEGSTVTVKVQLSADPKRDLTIPITTTNQDGATSDDYSGVPASLAFASGDTEKSFTLTAAQDTDNDDDESVQLSLGTLPAGVTAGVNGQATVNITDDDHPAVTVSFEQSTYSVAEGDTVDVKVQLNDDPERSVTIPITATNQAGATSADYSGVPASLAFASGDTEKSFTFTAITDTDDDNGESVKLTFGTLPTGVSAGSTNEATITITGSVVIPEIQAPRDWALTPDGLVQGDKFRLLFITETGHSSANTDIENYNAYVQSQANAGNAHAAIKPYSSWFRVLGSTEDVDARDNTMTTGTGVPIYWMNGDKVADNYPDFYDGSWDSETYARATGVLSSNTAHAWTGSQNNGTQSFTSGVSNALGASSVRRGTLNGSGDPLLSFTEQAGPTYGFYALSNIFIAPNSDATGQPAITGTPRVNETLSVDTSGITDPEGIANAAFTYQWVQVDDGDETDIDGATRSTYNPTDQDVDKQLKVRVSFTDDQGFTEGPLVSEPTFPIAGRDLLVRNTGQTAATALNPRLSTLRPKIAQGFTTGPDTEGYTLESLGIRFQSITDTSTAGAEITATLNEVSSTNPGTALCTLNDPAFFTSSGVHTFDAPGTCPTLAATTTYFLVIARSNVNSGTIRFNATNKTVEDPGSESGWSINNGRQEYRNASWEPSAGQPFMIEVKGESVREVVESSHRTWVENRRGDAATDYDNTGDFTIAQGFRTGGTAGVYEVHEISIDFDRGQPDPAAMQVRIVESSSLKAVDQEAIPTTYWKGGNFPARRIGTDDGTHTFTLALSQVIGTNILEANTNYFITIESTSTDSSTAAVVRMTETHDQTTGDGWAVDNHVYVKDKRDGSGWTRKTHQARIRIAGEYHEGISIVNEPRAYESCLGNLTNNRETLPEGFESCAFATQVDVGTLGSFSSNLSGVETTAWLPLYETIDFKIVIWPLVPAGGWVDVEYATEFPPGIYAHGSPAIADVDYIKKKGKVRFLPGDIAKTVSINIIDDRHEDSNEYVQVNLPSQETRHSSVDNYSLIRRSAFGTIYNTEETVELQSLNVSDLTVTEGEGATAEFTVWLSGEVTAPVLAHYATHDGSAKAGEHYTAASGTLLIPHGETSVTVSVPILNDEVYTGDRKFRLAISKPVNAGIFDPSGDATIEDDDPQPLTARFTNMPSGNHGESSFSFNISFNQDVATQYLVMQNDAMTVTNGEITHAERIDGSRDFWRITVQPDGGADVTVLLPATVSCSDTGAICTRDSHATPLSNSVTHPFPGTQLNAKFTGLDDYHDGSTPFNFTLGFSEEVDTTAAEIRDHALTISGGTFKTVVQKDDDSTRRWEVTVKPAGVDDIEVSIAGAIDCATDGHICTSEGELLAQAATQHSTGPELISVSDATVQEADGAELVFTVSIPEVWFGPDITVDYATSHGTATADDYTPTSGTLDFRWHKSLTVTVPVLTDTITEDAETITLTLSNPVNVVIADGEATGTIQDAEPVAARPPDSQPTGLPVITGPFRAHEPLTADTSAIIDANGLDEVSYSYQWIMSTNGSDADLSGATASTYTPNNDQVGNTFKVRVSFTDDDGYAHTLTSEATIPLTQPTDPIVWSADMLVVEYSSISIGAASADLFTNIGGTRSLSIQSLWSYVPDQDLRLAFNEALDDADDLSLIVGDLQLEFPSGSSGNGSFKWTGLDLDWQDSETIAVSIVPTSTLAETTVPNTAAAGQPTITGTPQVGQVLTADTSQVTDVDGLLSASYLYQWTAGDVNILSATRQSYTLDDSDLAKTIKVTVSFNDDRSNPETLTSAATEPVAARPNTAAGGAPSIQGVLQDQRRLTADTAGITDADGLTNATFAYQWIRVDDGSPSDIAGQTGSTYSLTSSDVGQSVQLQGHLHRRPRLLGVTQQRRDRRGNRLELHPQTTLAGHHRAQRPGQPDYRLHLQRLHGRSGTEPRRVHGGPGLRPDHHLPGRITGRRNRIRHRPELPAHQSANLHLEFADTRRRARLPERHIRDDFNQPAGPPLPVGCNRVRHRHGEPTSERRSFDRLHPGGHQPLRNRPAHHRRDARGRPDPDRRHLGDDRR